MSRRTILQNAIAEVAAKWAHINTLAKTVNITFEGDSNTSAEGHGAPIGQEWPTILMQRLGEGTWKNLASGGATMAQEGLQRQAQVDATFIDDPSVLNILMFWLGSNDMKRLETHASELFSVCMSYISRRRHLVIPLTILPRWSSSTPPSFEANRQQLNALWRSSGLIICDVAMDSRIGDAGDQYDAMFYKDGVHLNADGHQIPAAEADRIIVGLTGV